MLTDFSGLAQLALKQTPIEKYLYLSTIRKNNVHLFYRLVTDHIRVSCSIEKYLNTVADSYRNSLL